MGRSGRLLVILIFLLLSGSACGFTSPPDTVTATTAVIPATTLENPTGEPSATPSSTPDVTPAVPSISPDLYLPIGIANHPSDGRVTYLSLQGQLLGDLQAPDIGTGGFQTAVIAGPLGSITTPNMPALVYYALTNGGELRINSNNTLSVLVPAPNLFSLTGIPGSSLIAFTLLEYTDNGLRSLLFTADIDNFVPPMPILDNTNTESYAIKPLAISAVDENPVGIWYTMVPYGIGGDIVFEPRETLNYYDLATYQIKPYLDMTSSPVGISDDQSWVAYTPSKGIGPLSLVNQFDFSYIIAIPLRPDSDRGAGNAVFSPDNQYVTWKEASGSSMGENPAYQETIRIASIAGNIITEITSSSLTSITGLEKVNRVVPVGWLDTQTVVLEVWGNDSDTASIVSVNIDGTSLSLVAPGSFTGFLYP